ncbi:Asp23/Gls24 family envelope stress response protein [Tuanshanicoccus lijuaniae]|uniref:Asp23/Gls24 family envelope stress response protein n=1 Tax=Aerococcaceae bacterium zg-1292 TaxID=2774330 RepID=UPI0019387272|nr:Asp23/Gls24 family envelope stress response protein [Aerococcaceae bacterium zg-1292]MBF6625154.1 Asp23/Gls24 family envelope stress response protein [Aerococcaceae bacterium zg-BR9]MBF6978281.1 Asp23/Gls24 family envelope stress response protein [Aerococcaceae bacterium zg-BR22]MBS4456806.1 Asp23/Gls24 family envelope stress response protein [Aerococcaceae bacterium zg-A91]MBS4458634.1 Asp23/Gls24 family envelope stress response protein [Aerococcaceae bacterium zg-BR33]
MAIKIQTPNGQITLEQDVIATVVGAAVTDNYGVVGMVSKNVIRDNFTEILKKENYAKGVVISQQGNEVAVDVYILVSYGTKISVICQNIQQAVKYNVEQLLGFEISYVNVHVQGVKVVD